MDPTRWMSSAPGHFDNRMPHRRPLDGIGLSFPAEINIRPAFQVPQAQDYRHEYPRAATYASTASQDVPRSRIDDRVRTAWVKESASLSESTAAALPPYPTTPSIQHETFPTLHRHRPEIKFPSPPTPMSSQTIHPRHQHHRARHNEQDRTSQNHVGFMLLPDRPDTHGERRCSRLVTNQAEYFVIRRLREGSSSRVNHEVDRMLIEHVETTELFVEKRRTVASTSSRRRTELEINALLQITEAGLSQNITRIFETFYNSPSEYVSIVIEYCDHGTLEDFIDRYTVEKKTTPEGFAWHVLSSLSSALCVCHYGIRDATRSLTPSQDWTALHHFDIRPANIWLSSQGMDSAYPRVVLGNFSCVGGREEIHSGESNSVLVQYGTPSWLPQEGRHHHKYTPILGTFTDIWQVGAVIMAMCRLLQDPAGISEWPCGARYSFTLNNIICCCMNGDWNNRPSAVDLVLEISKEMSRGRAVHQYRT